MAMKKKKTFNIVDEIISDGIGLDGGNGGATSWKALGGDGKILFNKNNILFDYSGNLGFGGPAEPIESPFGNLVVGQKYTVVVDGVEYADLVAREDEGAICVGAPNTGPTSLEPIFVGTTERDGIIALDIFVYSPANTHDVKIQVGKINTIPTEYLPEPLWFGKSEGKVVVVPETTGVVEPLMGRHGVRIPVANDASFVGGQNYTVTLDGTVYDVVPVTEGGMVGLVVDGFSMAIVPDGGIPYLVVMRIDGETWVDGETLTIKITTVGAIVKTIDPEYLPNVTLDYMLPFKFADWGELETACMELATGKYGFAVFLDPDTGRYQRYSYLDYYEDGAGVYLSKAIGGNVSTFQLQSYGDYTFPLSVWDAIVEEA